MSSNSPSFADGYSSKLILDTSALPACKQSLGCRVLPMRKTRIPPACHCQEGMDRALTVIATELWIEFSRAFCIILPSCPGSCTRHSQIFVEWVYDLTHGYFSISPLKLFVVVSHLIYLEFSWFNSHDSQTRFPFFNYVSLIFLQGMLCSLLAYLNPAHPLSSPYIQQLLSSIEPSLTSDSSLL